MKIRACFLPLALLFAAFAATPMWAQSAATPAAYAIKGGKIFTLTGTPIENGVVIIRDGKIVRKVEKVFNSDWRRAVRKKKSA